MESNLNIFDILILFGVIQGVFLAISLLKSRFFVSSTNKYFAYTVLTLSMITFCGWIESEEPLLVILYNIVWELLLPPFVFIYFIKALEHQIKNKYWIKILFIPFAVSSLVHLVMDLDFQFNLYNLRFNKFHRFTAVYESIEYYLAFGFNLFITIWALRLVHSKSDSFPPIRIQWLSRFCRLLLTLILIWFIADQLEIIFGLDIWIFLWSGLSMAFVWICYYGIYQLQLLERNKRIRPLPSKINHRGSREFPKSTNQYFELLEKLMIDEQLFKNPDLGRDIVANRLGISAGYLSQLINSAHRNGFTEYINSYRVNAAKEMLVDSAFNSYSILAIGLESGFKTKSSFYATFQKFTGLSPGAYKKKY